MFNRHPWSQIFWIHHPWFHQPLLKVTPLLKSYPYPNDLAWRFSEYFPHLSIRPKHSFLGPLAEPHLDIEMLLKIVPQWEEATDYLISPSEWRTVPKGGESKELVTSLSHSMNKKFQPQKFCVKFPKINQWKAKIIISTNSLFRPNYLLLTTGAKATSSI